MLRALYAVSFALKFKLKQFASINIRLEATDLVGLLIRCESLHFGVMFAC